MGICMIERGSIKIQGGKNENGGNGSFHFKSHFVQSQITIFKDALSFSLSLFFPGFGRQNSLVVMLAVTSVLWWPGVVSLSSVHFKEKVIWNQQVCYTWFGLEFFLLSFFFLFFYVRCKDETVCSPSFSFENQFYKLYWYICCMLKMLSRLLYCRPLTTETAKTLSVFTLKMFLQVA